MKNIFFIGILFFSLSLVSQTKKPGPGKKPAAKTVAPKDSVIEEVVEWEEPPPYEFAVYTKRNTSKVKKQRMKLCLNLVNGDSIWNYCMNDSLLRDPEIKKILFQKDNGDSTYVLIYVMGFTKDPDVPECAAGREAKLFFVRLHKIRNQAEVKQKYIQSCYKTITKMSKEQIENWDGQSPLTVSYHRGSHFVDITFDPENYLKGIQSNTDAEAK